MSVLEDLGLLRVFLRIVDCGSISAAARALGMPQPTLSRRLRALEAQCGLALLRRDTHRMSLTEAGHRLRVDAMAMLEMAEGAAQRLRDQQTGLSGHLRLFSTIDFGQFAFTRLVSRFLQAHPGVTVELGYSNRPLRMIEEGFDAGVVVGDLTDDSVVAIEVGRLTRYLVACPGLVGARGEVRTIGDLRSWPWVSLTGAQFGDPRRVELHAPGGGRATLRIAPVLMTEGVTSIHEAVRHRAGVAVLPEWIVASDVASGRLVRVLPGWTARPLPVRVIHPNDRHLAMRVRVFRDFALAHLGGEVEPEDGVVDSGAGVGSQAIGQGGSRTEASGRRR